MTVRPCARPSETPKSSPAARLGAVTSTSVAAGIIPRSRAVSSLLWPEARRVRRHQARAMTTLRDRVVICHLKIDGYLGRRFFKGRAGDATNPVGYSFRRPWQRALCAGTLPRSYVSRFARNPGYQRPTMQRTRSCSFAKLIIPDRSKLRLLASLLSHQFRPISA
jgi:hypothetical protein